MKRHLLMILIYSLIFAPACKSRIDNASQAKDIDFSSWSDVIPKDDKEGQYLVKEMQMILGTMFVEGSLPFVVVNKKTMKKRPAYQKELFGERILTKNEALYIGQIDSQFLFRMDNLGINDRLATAKRSMRFMLTKHASHQYDTTQREFKTVDGTLLEINLDMKNRESIRESLVKQFSKINSMVNKYRLDELWKNGASNELKEMQNELREKRSQSTEGYEILVIYKAVVILIGLSLLITMIHEVRQGLAKFDKSMGIFMLICFAIMLVGIKWIMPNLQFEKQQKIRNRIAELETKIEHQLNVFNQKE